MEKRKIRQIRVATSIPYDSSSVLIDTFEKNSKYKFERIGDHEFLVTQKTIKGEHVFSIFTTNIQYVQWVDEDEPKTKGSCRGTKEAQVIS